MPICDVCSSPTTTQEGTGYTAEEFRRMVFQLGFQPDESTIQLHQSFGVSRQEAINQWKNVLVAGSSTGWLLCPKCALRASNYIYKPKGSGMEGMGATESWNSVLTTAAVNAALQSPVKQHAPSVYDTPYQSYSEPQERLTAGYKVLKWLMIIVALFSFVGIAFSTKPGMAMLYPISVLFSPILTGIYAHKFERSVVGWVLGAMLFPFITPFILIYVTKDDY